MILSFPSPECDGRPPVAGGTSTIFGACALFRARRLVRVKNPTRAQTSEHQPPPISFAARRTTMRIPSHRLRGGVVVGAPLTNGLRPRADCLSSRQVSLGRLGCKGVTRAADIQIHSGLRGSGSLPFHRGSAVCQDLRRDVSNAFHVAPVALAHRQDETTGGIGNVRNRVGKIRNV